MNLLLFLLLVGFVAIAYSSFNWHDNKEDFENGNSINFNSNLNDIVGVDPCKCFFRRRIEG